MEHEEWRWNETAMKRKNEIWWERESEKNMERKKTKQKKNT